MFKLLPREKDTCCCWESMAAQLQGHMFELSGHDHSQRCCMSVYATFCDKIEHYQYAWYCLVLHFILYTQCMEGYLSALSIQEETLHYSTHRLAHPLSPDSHRQWNNLKLIFTLLHHISSTAVWIQRWVRWEITPVFNLKSKHPFWGSKVVQKRSCRPKWRGLQTDYLCSDSWMENMTPDVEDFCWMEAKKVNSLLLLNSCTTFSVMCAGAWTALPTSEK